MGVPYIFSAKTKAKSAEVNADFSYLLNAPRGYLLNGKIVPSVASNNLTVAIKGLDGNDPSPTNPVHCRIGDTIRSITAALSVTKNAGTNWFSSGYQTNATYERDYFVYLGYNATDGVVIGFAQIPWGTEYDDFSTTNTNEKYCAISTITNAAAGDDYELIGRFAATLSAGAGYTWSVPTFTNKNLIQRPIYQSRWLTYKPDPTNFAYGNGTVTAAYHINERKCRLRFSFTLGSTSSVSGNLQISPPFTMNAAMGSPCPVGTGVLLDAGTATYLAQVYAQTTVLLTIGGVKADATFSYHAGATATVPFTWTTSDGIYVEGVFDIA